MIWLVVLLLIDKSLQDNKNHVFALLLINNNKIYNVNIYLSSDKSIKWRILYFFTLINTILLLLFAKFYF